MRIYVIERVISTIALILAFVNLGFAIEATVGGRIDNGIVYCVLALLCYYVAKRYSEGE